MTTDKDGNTIYKDLNENRTLAISSNNLWSEVFGSTAEPEDVILTEDVLEKFSNMVLPKASGGGYSGSNYQDFAINIPGVFSISYDKYGIAKNYDVVLIDRGGANYLRLEFGLLQEFFPGEYKLFSKDEVSAYSYEKKALAILGLAAGDEFINDYSSNNPDISMTAADWDMFETIFTTDYGDESLNINKGIIKDSFKRSLRAYFESRVLKEREEEYPYLLTKSMFDGIYGDEFSIYLKAYLTYAFNNEKPVFSQVYTDIFQRTNTPYKWKSYNTPTPAEGKVFARNALRYFTWGVEYPPFEGYGYNMYKRDMNPVWDIITGDQGLMDWVDGTANGERGNNYLSHGVYKTGPLNKLVPPEDKIAFAGEDNVLYKTLTVQGTRDTEALSFSRIDLLSSPNIARRQDPGITGRALDFVYKYDDAVKNEKWQLQSWDPITADADEVARLNDGTMGMTGNLLISRAEKDTTNKLFHGIGVGYEFTDEKSIKGISLTRGSAANRESPYDGSSDREKYPQMDRNSDEWISVYVKKNSVDDDWIKLDASEYIECVTDNTANSFVFYPAFGNRKPGYGIWQNYFSNSNTELVYSYLILNSSIDCKSIMIVDNSGNEFLNVSEMALFSDDPLMNLNYEQVEAVNDEKEIYWSSGEVTAPGSVNSIEEIMINGAPGTTFTVTGNDMNYIQINTKAVAPVRQISGWEPGSNSSEIVLKDNFVYTFGDFGIESSDFFIPLKDLSDADTWGSVVSITDTPFYWGSNLKSLGNPLPYVPGGLDGPRTFAYKMGEQLKARIGAGYMIWGKNALSTKAINNIYNTGYVDAASFSGFLGINKPFKPGFYINNSTGGFDSTLNIENVAGVDDMGILQGAMAMFDAGTFFNVKEEDITFGLDKYYGMNEADTYGLDSSGKPLFEPEGENSYESILKLTPSDIERNSVIIPDISQIQKGDILVRNTKEESHVGIVVGFLDNIPAVPTPAANWWDNVLVLSIRAGFQMATLGTWGNPDGLFGGFSEHPKEYVIRRLMKKTGNLTGLKTENWESVKTVYPQWYTHYGEYRKIAEEYKPVKYDDNENELYQKMKTEQYSEHPYFKRLPPTSLPDKKLTNSLFYDRMRVSGLTGWRKSISEDGKSYLSYHRGIDLVDGRAVPGEVLDAYSSIDGYGSIYAPEDGLYWVIDRNGYSTKEYIQFSDTEMLVVDGYGKAYGDMGVLVTPQRIYLFAHMSLENDTIGGYTTGINHDFNSMKSPNVYYGGEALTEFPTTYNEAITVKKGAWIGVMGDNSYGIYSGMHPHIHLEVYESFPDYKPVGFNYFHEPVEPYFEQGRIQKIRKANFQGNEAEGESLVTIDFVKKNLQWQRIDPLTIFSTDGGNNTDNNLYYLNNADGTQDIINKMEDMSVMGTDIETISTNEQSVLFSDWPAPVTWEGVRP